MLPFCGYNMADYFGHWLSMADRNLQLPRIFQVNWFRKDSDGKFLWPGFSENIRPLAWVVDRLEGKAQGVETPIGVIPADGELNTEGLEISEEQLQQLFEIDFEAWSYEVKGTAQFFEQFGGKLPRDLAIELSQLEDRLKSSLGAAVKA
jgi:phosphoenolpyruvate carboxykinase (GTP)